MKNFIKSLVDAIREPDVTKRDAALDAVAKEFPPEDDKDDKNVHKANDEMCKCADCMSKRTEKAAGVDAALTKRFDALEKSNKDLIEKNSNLEKSLAIEVNKRADEEVRAILKTFTATPLDLNTDVAIYRKMRDTDPAMFDRTMAVMKATDAQLAASQLYKNVGSSQSAGAAGSAWAQIEAKADAMMEKSTKEMTREQALNKVMDQNPKLVKQYRTEQ